MPCVESGVVRRIRAWNPAVIARRRGRKKGPRDERERRASARHFPPSAARPGRTKPEPGEECDADAPRSATQRAFPCRESPTRSRRNALPVAAGALRPASNGSPPPSPVAGNFNATAEPVGRVPPRRLPARFLAFPAYYVIPLANARPAGAGRFRDATNYACVRRVTISDAIVAGVDKTPGRSGAAEARTRGIPGGSRESPGRDHIRRRGARFAPSPPGRAREARAFFPHARKWRNSIERRRHVASAAPRHSTALPVRFSSAVSSGVFVAARDGKIRTDSRREASDGIRASVLRLGFERERFFPRFFFIAATVVRAFFRPGRRARPRRTTVGQKKRGGPGKKRAQKRKRRVRIDSPGHVLTKTRNKNPIKSSGLFSPFLCTPHSFRIV